MTGPSARRARPQSRGIVRAVAAFLFVLLSLLTVSWLIVGAAIVGIVPGGWRTIGTAALWFSVVPLALFLGVRGARIYAGRWLRLLVFRPFWYAQLWLLGTAVASTLGAVAGLPFGASGFLARSFVIIAAAGFLVFAISGYIGSRRLMRRTLEIQHPALPAALDGLRIVQLSDLHVGPQMSERLLRHIAAVVRDARPDLVMITGDQVDDFPRDAERFGAFASEFTAPLGTYVIPGNHDIYAGWAEVIERLRALPMTVLVNDSHTLEHKGARLTIAGTGDPAAGPGGDSSRGAVNFPELFASIPPKTFVIALAHNPALWPTLAQREVPLTLSGHTHWGQFAIPSRNWSLASAFLDFGMGLHQQGQSLLWINPGTGYWGIPFRLGAWAEVTVIVLRAAQSQVAVRETEYSS